MRARSAKQLAWLRGGLAGGACGCTASEARANNSFDRGDWREGEVAVTGLWPFIAGAVAETVADALDIQSGSWLGPRSGSSTDPKPGRLKH